MPSTAVNNHLYVITAIFNPFRFKSRARLYQNFAKHMQESGVTLITIEAAFGDHDFEVTVAGHPWHIQLRTDQILWHKERMLNLAYGWLKHKVPDLRNVGWFDSDVLFANPDWVGETVHKLTHLAVLQPFGQAINLGPEYEEQWSAPSAYRHFIEARGYHQTPTLPTSYTYRGHPGLAWCARREALDAMGGLYERCAAGSADTIVSNALKGDWDVYLPGKPSAQMIESIRSWSVRAYAVTQGKIGFVRGALLHFWHGRPDQRGYDKRWDILSYHQFDPNADIVVDPVNHLYRWAGNKPAMEDDIRLSLGSRNEDSVEP